MTLELDTFYLYLNPLSLPDEQMVYYVHVDGKLVCWNEQQQSWQDTTLDQLAIEKRLVKHWLQKNYRLVNQWGNQVTVSYVTTHHMADTNLRSTPLEVVRTWHLL